MKQRIEYADVKAMLLAAVDEIRANADLLTKLDSVIGDGDHGPTMVRSMDAVAKAVADDAGTSPKDLLYNVGWAILGIDGGSTGPLLGSLFMGMSEAFADTDSLDAAGVAAMFAAGVAKMRKTTRAAIGDKTMMDALLPAADTLAQGEADVAAGMAKAADAAAAGAESTADMRAKFGRARNLGDRVLGHVDPGATSVSLLFKGFARALKG